MAQSMLLSDAALHVFYCFALSNFLKNCVAFSSPTIRLAVNLDCLSQK